MYPVCLDLSAQGEAYWKQAHPDGFLLVMEEVALLGRLVATARKQRLQQLDSPSPSAFKRQKRGPEP
jgi:hypothetical protein